MNRSASTSPSDLTLPKMLWQAEERFPERPALLEREKVVDYRALAARVRQAALLLSEMCGVERGDRVTLLLPNSSRFVVMHYAVLSLGAVVAPLNPQLRGGPLEDAITLTDPVCLVTDAAHAGWVVSIGSRSPRLRSLVVFTERGEEAPLQILTGAQLDEVSTLQLDSLSPAPAAPEDPSADDDAILFMTSGTTGRPKGILITHRQALLGIDSWVRRWNFGPDTVSLMVAPFFHVVFNPLVLGAHRVGAAAVVLTTLTGRAAIRAIAKQRATALMGTPALFIQLLQDASSLAADLSSIDAVIYGAAPTPVPVIRSLRQRFPDAGLYNCYGLTESCSSLTCLGPEQLAGREESVGLPHSDVEITIRDESHRELAQGEPGEIYCRGRHVIRTYYGATEADAERFHDGWLRTGDIGYRDADGFLYLVGRRDERVNISGEKVYPAAIENVLYGHPRVGDAAVIGIPDAKRGQVIKAFIVPAGSGEVDLGELKRFCAGQLPPLLIPRSFEILDELPRNPSGKIMRSQLS